MQSFCSERKLKIPSSSNAAYCKARGRLASQDIDAVRASVLERLLTRVQEDQRWLGHDVKVVDGSSISLDMTAVPVPSSFFMMFPLAP